MKLQFANVISATTGLVDLDKLCELTRAAYSLPEVGPEPRTPMCLITGDTYPRGPAYWRLSEQIASFYLMLPPPTGRTVPGAPHDGFTVVEAGIQACPADIRSPRTVLEFLNFWELYATMLVGRYYELPLSHFLGRTLCSAKLV
jgi:hypothetical protein